MVAFAIRPSAWGRRSGGWWWGAVHGRRHCPPPRTHFLHQWILTIVFIVFAFVFVFFCLIRLHHVVSFSLYRRRRSGTR